MVRRVVLCGGGSLAVEVAGFLQDVSRANSGEGWMVSDVVSTGSTRSDDLRTIGGSDFALHRSLSSVEDAGQKEFLICIGDAVARHKVLAEIRGLGYALGLLIHPGAYVAATASIGRGTVVYPGVFVGPFARVGSNVLLNAQAVVGHDAVLGDSVVLSPGARLCGHAACGPAAFLGTGASVLPKVSLGAYSKLSAGSVLKRPAGEGFVMHGNPAIGRHMLAVPPAFD